MKTELNEELLSEILKTNKKIFKAINEKQFIELNESDVLEINMVVDGVSVFYIKKPMIQALKSAADVMHSEKPKLHHTSKFELQITMIK